MAPLYEYRSYKKYIQDYISTLPGGGRGFRQKLAEAATCQLPYVSHVLGGEYHFSPEQGAGISELLGLNDEEKEFFLLLISYQRAGTHALKGFYKKLLEEKSTRYNQIKNRLKAKETLDEEKRNTYYSSWHFAAIHMLITIPEFRTRNLIAERLQLPIVKVDQVINFLLECGLIEKKGSQLLPKSMDIHLDNESSSITKHHTNWRLRSITSLDNETTTDLHYSLVFTIEPDDLPKIRELLLEAIKNTASIIRPSQEKELHAFCVDLFRV